MAKVTFVKKARKDVPNSDIKKGESYFWWEFRYGGKHVSRTQPRPSQLTGSEFLSTVLRIGERINDVSLDTDVGELQNIVDEIKDELETLQSETQDKRDNMPEQLQEAPTGELLQNRIDSLQEMMDEIDNITIPDALEEGEGDQSEIDNFESERTSAIEELQNISYNGE